MEPLQPIQIPGPLNTRRFEYFRPLARTPAEQTRRLFGGVERMPAELPLLRRTHEMITLVAGIVTATTTTTVTATVTLPMPNRPTTGTAGPPTPNRVALPGAATAE